MEHSNKISFGSGINQDIDLQNEDIHMNPGMIFGGEEEGNEVKDGLGQCQAQEEQIQQNYEGLVSHEFGQDADYIMQNNEIEEYQTEQKGLHQQDSPIQNDNTAYIHPNPAQEVSENLNQEQTHHPQSILPTNDNKVNEESKDISAENQELRPSGLPAPLPPPEDIGKCEEHSLGFSYLWRNHNELIWEGCLSKTHFAWRDSITSLGIIANEIANRVNTVTNQLEESIDLYFNQKTYEEKMKEIRRTIDKTYDEISQELARSKDQVLADLKKLLVEDVEKTPKQEKIELEREKEYITVSEQILAMKKDMQNMLSHFQYQKIYKERVALNKVMDAVKVVNEDLQNHINDSRPPVEEITWSLRNLVSKIKATTDLQRLKFNQYKELGIPNFHMFTPFQLFFKKFKKKLIENDKELSLLDAGVYWHEKWLMMTFEEQEKYIRAASYYNDKIQRKNREIREKMDPEIRRIREDHERRMKEEKEARLWNHFSVPKYIAQSESEGQERVYKNRFNVKKRILKLHHLRDPNMDIELPNSTKSIKKHSKKLKKSSPFYPAPKDLKPPKSAQTGLQTLKRLHFPQDILQSPVSQRTDHFQPQMKKSRSPSPSPPKIDIESGSIQIPSISVESSSKRSPLAPISTNEPPFKVSHEKKLVSTRIGPSKTFLKIKEKLDNLNQELRTIK